MSNIISFQEAAQSVQHKKKESQPDLKQKNRLYLEALKPLVGEASDIAKQFKLSTKDVLTDALCVYVEAVLLNHTGA